MRVPRKSGCGPNPAAACHHLSMRMRCGQELCCWQLDCRAGQLQQHGTLHACTAFMLCA